MKNIVKRQSLFWDANLEELDEQKNRDFIIQRILEKGNLEDLNWAVEFYGKDYMQEVFLKNFDVIDSKSRNFWCFYFNLNKEECIRNQSTNEQSWFLRK